MRLVGLVMAGGQSTRMTRSGITTPKPLLEIGGRSLLAHNVQALASSGVEHIYVAVGHQALEIQAAIEDQCQAIGQSHGIAVEPVVETTPLGNIGALGQIPHDTTTIVVFADNLTALPLTSLVEHHRATAAALTLAAHVQPFVMPFGELTLEGTAVRSYTEKPVTDVLVASAVTVASPKAIALAGELAPLGLADLAAALIQADLPVESFRHQAPWIDVNDQAALLAATELVETHAEEFAWFLELPEST